MNLFFAAIVVVIFGLIFFFTLGRRKESNKEVDFHLVTNVGSLRVFAPNAAQDLSFLAEVITPGTRRVTEATLREFFRHGGTLAFATDKERIIGAACIIYLSKYNGKSARLEHVSVLPEYSGFGIGRKLTMMLIVDVRMMGESKYIDLTTEPWRKGANRLYESLGFKIRKTNPRRLAVSASLK